MPDCFDSPYCEVSYQKPDNMVLLTWKKIAAFDHYRQPTTYALELLKKHPGSNLIIDARNGFEDEKEDVEWGFSFLIPKMAETGCKMVGFIMCQANNIEEEMAMWSVEFGKYFTVYKGVSYKVFNSLGYFSIDSTEYI